MNLEAKTDRIARGTAHVYRPSVEGIHRLAHDLSEFAASDATTFVAELDEPVGPSSVAQALHDADDAAPEWDPSAGTSVEHGDPLRFGGVEYEVIAIDQARLLFRRSSAPPPPPSGVYLRMAQVLRARLG
jgi:hypothetical protein